MPQFFAALGAAIGGTGGAFLIMYAPQLAYAAMLIGTAAYSNYKSAKAKREARAQFNAAQVDRLVNVSSTVAQQELVLGRVRKGGFVFFRGSSGTHKERFTVLIALAAHEIDGVETIFLNEQAVTLDGNGWVQEAPYHDVKREFAYTSSGSPEPPDAIPGTFFDFEGSAGYERYVHTYRARIRIHLGAPGQVASSDVLANFPGMWADQPKATNTAYLECDFFYDEGTFSNGAPNVTAVIRGARCFDPRTGTTVFSENPSIHARHVLTHSAFGRRSVVTAAEDARIIAAANACDTPEPTYTGSAKLYRSSIVIPYGTPTKDIFDNLAQAMGGQWAYAAGQLFLRPGTYSAPVMSLTEVDLAVVERTSDGQRSSSPIVISPHKARNEKFNRVVPRIWDSSRDYLQTDLTAIEPDNLITRDGSVISKTVDMPAVFFNDQAAHIAAIMIRDARDPLVFSVAVKMSAYKLQVFDIVEWTLARFGWTTPKQFVVIGRKWNGNGSITLTFKETHANIFVPGAWILTGGYSQNTELPKPWILPTPVITSITSGTDELFIQGDGTIASRVNFQYSVDGDASLTGFDIQYSRIDVVSWQTVNTLSDERQVYIYGLQDGSNLIFRVRARNSLTKGDWSTHQRHTVIGKSEPPPPFDVFSVGSQPDGTRQFNFGYTVTQTPLDWAGAKIRYVPGNNPTADWDSALELEDKDTFYTASPIERNAPLAGQWTFFCRSRDTSKILSTSKVFVITLPARRTGDVYDEWVEADAEWPGTKTDCVVTPDNILVAVDSATWNTFLNSWGSGSTSAWTSSPATVISYIMERDLGSVVAGSIDVDLTATGDVLIELSTSDDGISWSAYGAGSASFASRYLRVRVTVTASIPAPVPSISKLNWQINAFLQSEYINNVDISILSGSQRIGVGDIRVPINNSYTFIKRVDITIEDASAGSWSYQRIDNSATGPRFQFKLNGVLTDPTYVDFYIEGL
jgi:hypothetical protein